MAVEDRSPEARNLTVISLGFIVYFYAGGYFGDNQLTLEVVNISFERGWVMGLLSEFALFWCAFRYYVESRAQLSKPFYEYVQNSVNELAQRSLRALTDELKPAIVPEGMSHWMFARFIWGSNRRPALIYNIIGSNGAIYNSQEVIVRESRHLWPIYNVAFSAIFRMGEVSRYLGPWLLFFSAVIGWLFIEPGTAPIQK